MTPLTMSRSLVCQPLAGASRPQHSAGRPRVMSVCASADASSRRAALTFLVAGLGLSLANQASAKVKVPFQESIGRSSSSTEASMSAFNMEGTKKRGLAPGLKKAAMEKAKAGYLAGLGK